MSLGLRIPLVLALAGCAVACRRDGVGASSPERLLAKLTTGLDELDAAKVASCFDPQTPQGTRVAELCNKGLTVLKRAQDLESAIRRKYGESYVVDHVLLPGPALVLRDFRSKIAQASLERGEGNNVRLVVAGATAASMYSRGNTWFLQPAKMPFGGDETMRVQANRILNRLLDHVDEALKLVESSGPEKEFRARMAELGRKTRDQCIQELWTLMNTMRSKKLLPN